LSLAVDGQVKLVGRLGAVDEIKAVRDPMTSPPGRATLIG